MKLSRDLTLKIHFVLDQLLPPVLRDCRAFMRPLMRMMFSEKAEKIMDFKERLPMMTPEEYAAFYEETASFHMPRETDLNRACVAAILGDVLGSSALDAGCGRGFLARKLSEFIPSVTAADMAAPGELGGVRFVRASVSDFSSVFAPGEFDTVICTHVLEHVLDFKTAVRELRRVAAKRLIIVVPMQRPYRYTFDLHARFFPYVHSFLFEMAPLREGTFHCAPVGGDIYFREDF
ncbi:MAG: class I SAM-dependent methyltransferase [Synergistaceae bacterium]|jgi:ubiquinone/menaquinone biosynthesis C-methylase UbiE|nr:class I SAM-dependent methyltransferase [Synergistaceae bacterium]